MRFANTPDLMYYYTCVFLNCRSNPHRLHSLHLAHFIFLRLSLDAPKDEKIDSSWILN